MKIANDVDPPKFVTTVRYAASLSTFQPVGPGDGVQVGEVCSG